jgi:hypothetical protein
MVQRIAKDSCVGWAGSVPSACATAGEAGDVRGPAAKYLVQQAALMRGADQRQVAPDQGRQLAYSHRAVGAGDVFGTRLDGCPCGLRMRVWVDYCRHIVAAWGPVRTTSPVDCCSGMGILEYDQAAVNLRNTAPGSSNAHLAQ